MNSIPLDSLIENILSDVGRNKERCIEILQRVQDSLGWLSPEATHLIVQKSEITPAQIAGVTTFYNHFRLTPIGKHSIKVCIGTACHVKGAPQIIETIRRVLKIKENEDTDPDSLFTLLEVACLGCCSLAPVLLIDNFTYSYVTPNNIEKAIKDFLIRTDKNKSENASAKEKDLISQLESKALLPSSKIGYNKTSPPFQIFLGMSSCCIASGAEEIYHQFSDHIKKEKLNCELIKSSCSGLSCFDPFVEIVRPDGERFFYLNIAPHAVKDILNNHFQSVPKNHSNKLFINLKNLISEKIATLLYDECDLKITPHSIDHPLLKNTLSKQVPIALKDSGHNSPTDLEHYLQGGGFSAIKKVLKGKRPDEVISIILESGLRGRGGGGFPTANKWSAVKKSESSEKYIVINGDEGDPGAFMDRMLLESHPFRVIEGVMIAAFAVGASKGFFYIRSEYPLALSQVKRAIEVLKENQLLGDQIFGTDFSLTLEVKEGAGAFVCGEETALISSIEGKRGVPELRPPYPSESGLFGKPTLVNNVETFSLVPHIIGEGAASFSKWGTNGSSGTKVFALAGKINKGGLIEVPMGITLSELIFEMGGGIPNGKNFKAIQIGGPSGGCIPSSLLDSKIDYESLKEHGAIMGSGGLVVLDETDCMVDIAKYFLSFTQAQSCGKCTFCRVGTKRMLELLTRFTDGLAEVGDIEKLEDLAHSIKKGSLCGLGQSAPNPVLSTLGFFREEYEAHIQKTCPAKKCKSLIHYEVSNLCIGCTKCYRVCPVDAIACIPYKKAKITELCIKCDECRKVCPTGAISVTP